MQSPVKRYYTTDKLTNQLPSEFVNSPNLKHILVLGCRLFVNDEEIDDVIEGFNDIKFVSLHSDFIHDRRDLDSFVCFCNTRLEKRKKYQQLYDQKTFNIWFCDVDGTKIELTKDPLTNFFINTYQYTPPVVDPTAPPPQPVIRRRKIRFVLELLLSY